MKISSKIYFNNLLLILLLSGFFYSCTRDHLEIVEEEASQPEKIQQTDLIEGQYVILISDTPAAKDSKAAANLESVTKEVEQLPNTRIISRYKNALTGFTARLTEKQVQQLKKDPRVVAVEQDKRLSFNFIGEVQEYVTWGLDRIDQTGATLDRAYAFSSTGNGVTAYIVDSGIRYSHADFEGRATLGYDVAYELYPEKRDPAYGPGWDCLGHGTHVAGTVGGENYGVAKDVNLVSVKLSSGCEGTFFWSDVIAATDWLTHDVIENDRFPAVVNMSLGGTVDAEVDMLKVAIDNSIKEGINYVVAAGNSNSDACEITPAKYPEVLTVGATEIGDKKAGFSSYGDCVDLYAPGVAILSASVKSDTSVVAYGGTSMASPHVAGVVALFLENDPEATPVQVHAAVVANSEKGVVWGTPSGTTNMLNSLWEPVIFTPPAPPQLNLEVVGVKEKNRTKIQLRWDPTDDPSVIIYRNGEFFREEGNYGRVTFSESGKAGDTYSICEKNYNNCSENIAPNYGGDFEMNQPPVADFTYEINDLEVTFLNQCSDPDGKIVSYTWHMGDGKAYSAPNIRYTYSQPGIYEVALWIEDNEGARVNSGKIITVGEVETTPVENLVLEARGYKKGGKWTTELSWNNENVYGNIDVYRNGSFLQTVSKYPPFTDFTDFKGSGSLTYEICLSGERITCSNEVTVTF